jgi:hypothetical protein
MENVAFQGEVMLLGWRETHSGGAQITLLLSDPEQLEVFKRMTVKHGKVAGQRLACVMVEIGDDEMPVAQERKGGPLSVLAGRWCATEHFRTWFFARFSHLRERALLNLLRDDVKPTDEEVVAEMMRIHLGVSSRADIDHVESAKEAFHRDIRIPYSALIQHDENT